MDQLAAGIKEMVIFRDIALENYKLVDNTGMEFLAIAGTFAQETGLSIVISAYSGGA
jgi:hypothetical protein